MTIAVHSKSAVFPAAGTTVRESKANTADAFGAALSAAEQNGSAVSAQSAAQPAAQPTTMTTLGGRRTSLADLTTDFQEWRTDYASKVLADRQQAVESQSSTYLTVLEKASAQDGLSDPKAFLKSLSPQELHALQTIHSLADPINPDGLTEEGAQNLILPPNQAEDVDHDGFNMVGLAKMWQFPPNNAPDSVKQAWKTATKDLNGNDLALMASFMPLVIPGMTNGSAYLPEDTDYSALTAKTIEGLEYAKRFDKEWQRPVRENQIALLEKFQAALDGAV